MAKLPSKSPSIGARATLQRFCAVLERRSDAAAAHRAHQSQTAPPLAGQMQSHRLLVLHAARHCHTRRNKSPLNASLQTKKIKIKRQKSYHVHTAFHASRLHRTSHVLFNSIYSAHVTSECWAEAVLRRRREEGTTGGALTGVGSMQRA